MVGAVEFTGLADAAEAAGLAEAEATGADATGVEADATAEPEADATGVEADELAATVADVDAAGVA